MLRTDGEGILEEGYRETLAPTDPLFSLGRTLPISDAAESKSADQTVLPPLKSCHSVTLRVLYYL